MVRCRMHVKRKSKPIKCTKYETILAEYICICVDMHTFAYTLVFSIAPDWLSNLLSASFKYESAQEQPVPQDHSLKCRSDMTSMAPPD